MAEGSGEGLSAAQLAEIERILAPYLPRVRRAILFGSRAQGTARSRSDIDLAIDGDLSGEEIARLGTLFEDSNLPVTVDVVAYDASLYPPLRAHIDRVGRTLFTGMGG